MSDEAYSTIIDAVLFLALVAVSAAIMSPAITGHAAERSLSDRGLRELSASTLVSLESERVDFFEYRVLGDVADAVAGAGGINATSDILYRDVTKALLGRGSRHRTVMDIAAGDAACQFLAGPGAIRLNPVTVEYDRAASELIDRSIRSKLDRRYGYEFTLRWSPLAGVPFGGEVKAGRPHPAGALSSSTTVTMPYTTNITMAVLANANACDLQYLGQVVSEYNADADSLRLRQNIRQVTRGCLKNTTGLIVDEIWANTLGSYLYGSRLDPVQALKRFSNNETLNSQALVFIDNNGRDLVADLAIAGNADAIDRLSDAIADDIIEGSMDAGGARSTILAWLHSRYTPSRAVAALSVWVEPYA
ncbi:MAG: hypothetical protein A4E28_00131 [Methanocella sp. PtaU1.Bin125]|nr:MAG: hypothetical protein A4E28_00131 [Methanocella sp. PtaU1.Bin125]